MTSTAHAVSPDSGEHWTREGAWEVTPGVYRIPLPLPLDGLRAVNVYAIVVDRGLVLIDGGWAIPGAREVLQRSLHGIGFDVSDIRRFLVTHMHRDHYSLARILGTELGAEVVLGRDDEPGIAVLAEFPALAEHPLAAAIADAGAPDVAECWKAPPRDSYASDPRAWAYPDLWMEGDTTISLGARELDAIHTPGHTPGHFVFADRSNGSLFAGDHILPTITPSIGFLYPIPPDPLGDFMASLTRVRTLPDMRILPAHGPVAPSTHARVDELLRHHDTRLELCLAALSLGRRTAAQVAAELPWTRYETTYAGLDWHNRGMAVLETHAHLELLAARGRAVRVVDECRVESYISTESAVAAIPPAPR